MRVSSCAAVSGSVCVCGLRTCRRDLHAKWALYRLLRSSAGPDTCAQSSSPSDGGPCRSHGGRKAVQPVVLHHQRHRPVASSGYGKVRYWRQAYRGWTNAAHAHARTAIAATPQSIALPSQPASTPPASPTVALAYAAQQITPSNSEPGPAVAAASTVTDNPPTAKPHSNPVAPDQDRSTQLLARAFSQQQAAAHVEPPRASPSNSDIESAPREADTIIPAIPARSSGGIEVTANGLQRAWWAENFPARVAILSVAFLLVAVGALSIARASSRRLQSS